MDARINPYAKKIVTLLVTGIFLTGILLSGCALPGSQPTTVQTPTIANPVIDSSPYPVAEVVFNVQVPAGTEQDAQVFIDLLDEVTGLALNPTRYPMQQIEGKLYTVTLPVPVGSVVKYRYSRQGNIPAIEYNTLDQQVRYRLTHVDGPSVVTDIVPAWMDMPYTGPTGRITGVVLDRDTGAPIPNLMINTSGLTTFTTSDGSFVLDGVPVGTHTLVAYAMDGDYPTFQQGASVAAESTTPAPISLSRLPTVNVTFQVTIPTENVVGVPVRLAGNFYQTGNTFADLDGGINVITSRMPLLTQNPGGKYTVSLALPVGADFRYKYTLGDGFWNAEQTSAGAMHIRQLIVPQEDTIIEDTVASWRSGNFAPVHIEVNVPANTPESDYVSIQFNPYGWTEPIPMWSLGENRWMYILFSPLQILGEVQYRFCRNDQCGYADDAITMGQASSPYVFTPSDQSQTFENKVDKWGWWDSSSTPTSVLAAEVQPRGAGFITGVELQPDYHPSMQSRYGVALEAIKTIEAGWVVFTPTWTYTRTDPVALDPVPGSDPLWTDIAHGIGQTASSGLHAAVFPIANTIIPQDYWWTTVKRDAAWWEGWFTRYRTFLLHHADLAESSGAQAFIIGGDGILPALPDAVLLDGSPTNVPDDAAARWTTLIQEIRSHFHGSLLWAAPFKEDMPPLPGFTMDVDQIYLLWSPAISDRHDPSVSDLEAETKRLLDSQAFDRIAGTGKPVILAAGYASNEGSSTSYTGGTQPGGLMFDKTGRLGPDSVVDLQEQVDIYNALFSAINDRDDVAGIVVRGMYFPAPLQDPSSSVYGKPAWDVLWYWFPQLTGTP